MLAGRQRAKLQAVPPGYLRERRWFRGKTRPVRGATITDAVPVGEHAVGGPAGYLTMVEVEFADGEPETYVLPLTAEGRRRAHDDESLPVSTLARLETSDGHAVLYDAL